MKKVAIIMAGGKGERLWPRSRNNRPKQFLELIPGKGTLIQQTIKRVLKIIDIKDVYVITNKNYRDIVHEQLPELPVENIICEPMAKNTSPAIEYATTIINKKYKDAIEFVLPSDHVILNVKAYLDALGKAYKLAERGYLVTLGIKPLSPNTGYGYIEANGDNVLSFKEKPTMKIAKKYFKSGNYYWNSGMFIWKVSSILNAFEKYMPCQHSQFKKLNELNLEGIYNNLESISVDYAIMEKARNVKVIESDFGWDDVGSWLSLTRINKIDNDGNYFENPTLSLDSRKNIICVNKKLVAILGVDNLVVVDTNDVLLITSTEKVSDIKKITSKINNEHQYKKYR